MLQQHNTQDSPTTRKSMQQRLTRREVICISV